MLSISPEQRDRAVGWIMTHRVPGRGRLDIEAMAALFQARVVLTDLGGEEGYSGLLLPYPRPKGYEWRISINEVLSTEEQLMTFGHEVGHLFWQAILRRLPVRRPDWPDRQPDQQEAHERMELFCEWFGRELLVPHRLIDPRTHQGVTRVAVRYGVAEEVVLAQLMSQGKLPSVLVSASGKIVCRDCGYYLKFRHCACRELRDQWEAERHLPKIGRLRIAA